MTSPNLVCAIAFSLAFASCTPDSNTQALDAANRRIRELEAQNAELKAKIPESENGPSEQTIQGLLIGVPVVVTDPNGASFSQRRILAVSDIKRGDVMQSTGTSRIPVDTLLYPIRATVATENQGSKQVTCMFVQNAFHEWKCIGPE